MTLISKRTKFELVGKGVTALDPSDYMTSGGEAAIYKKGNTIVKLYSDVGKMRRDDMAGKIIALSELKHDVIAAPRGVVINSKGNPQGLYMPYVSGEPLSRIFTNTFWQKNGFTSDDAVIVADKMHDAVRYTHEKKITMVDANELSWIVGKKNRRFHNPKIIDVDSWSVGKWGATVIMPSIRDWCSNRFDESSDWFAWGIVTFQLFTGIHPYKGTLDGYKKSDLEKRMRENASVFRRGVSLNRNVRDFGDIPGPLLDWYVRTFDKGQRSIPPLPSSTNTVTYLPQAIIKREVAPAGSLVFTSALGNDDPVEQVFPSGLVRLRSDNLYDLKAKRLLGVVVQKDAEIVRVDGGWLALWCVNDFVEGVYISQTSLTSQNLISSISAKKLVRSGDRVFAIASRGVGEIGFRNVGKPMITIDQSWGVLYNSTEWFDGMGVQVTIGAKHVVMPFGENAFTHVRVKEIDSVRIVGGSAGDRYVHLKAVTSTGQYQEIGITLDASHTKYAISLEDVDHHDSATTHLPKGVVASIVKDNQLRIYVPSNGTLKTVADGRISTAMQLARWDDAVMIIENGSLHRVSMT